MLTQERGLQDDEVEEKERKKQPAGKINVRADLFEESYSPEQYEQMMAMYEGTLQHIEEGEIVKSLKEGDEVEVFLEHLEDKDGAVVLSKKKADFMRVWERIRVAYESDEPV